MGKRLVYGVGINDYDGPTSYVLDGRRVKCPYYTRWNSMLERCYSESYHEKRPSYIGCTVVPEWLNFENFKKWMMDQDWKDKCLDKDFLSGESKRYSPETCVFIDKELNNFPSTSTTTRGDYPIGVTYTRSYSKFRAQCNDGKGECVYIGLFDDIISAHKSWQKMKASVGRKLLEQQTDPRVINALTNMIWNLQYEHDNDIETTKICGVKMYEN